MCLLGIIDGNHEWTRRRKEKAEERGEWYKLKVLYAFVARTKEYNSNSHENSKEILCSGKEGKLIVEVVEVGVSRSGSRRKRATLKERIAAKEASGSATN
ncbi:hypothetical protein VNO77_40859 [Canavalia gladiata]|uniref:Uncharacterized protein n=1 Tax=Canavalia gladiata TaxID=3824 RepID=A0AAN9PRJ8_CANGL